MPKDIRAKHVMRKYVSAKKHTGYNYQYSYIITYTY